MAYAGINGKILCNYVDFKGFFIPLFLYAPRVFEGKAKFCDPVHTGICAFVKWITKKPVFCLKNKRFNQTLYISSFFNLRPQNL